MGKEHPGMCYHLGLSVPPKDYMLKISSKEQAVLFGDRRIFRRENMMGERVRSLEMLPLFPISTSRLLKDALLHP